MIEGGNYMNRQSKEDKRVWVIELLLNIPELVLIPFRFIIRGFISILKNGT